VPEKWGISTRLRFIGLTAEFITKIDCYPFANLIFYLQLFGAVSMGYFLLIEQRGTGR